MARYRSEPHEKFETIAGNCRSPVDPGVVGDGLNVKSLKFERLKCKTSKLPTSTEFQRLLHCGIYSSTATSQIQSLGGRDSELQYDFLGDLTKKTELGLEFGDCGRACSMVNSVPFI